MSQTTRTDYRHALYRDFSFRCSSCPESASCLLVGGVRVAERAQGGAGGQLGEGVAAQLVDVGVPEWGQTGLHRAQSPQDHR
jgi:hypothetical protein